MTGYGEGRCTILNYKVSIQIISLNSRYLEINFIIPSIFDFFRLEFENEIKKIFSRGKIVVKIDIDVEDEIYIKKLHDFIVKAEEYFKKHELEANNIPFYLYFDLAKVNSIQHKPIETLTRYEKLSIKRCFKNTLQKVLQMRKIEGKKTEEFLKERLSIIQKTLNEIVKMKKEEREEAEKKYKDKGIENGETLSNLLLKLDVSEEVERLLSHIKYFKRILREKGVEKGKKLDFLSQEITRELTTLNSKTHKPDIVHKTILLKEEVEKIREQLRNIQ